MLRLYYAPHTCALAAMIALEATRLPHQAVVVDLAGDRAELLRASPQGKVPVLRSSDEVVTETLAIIYRLDQLCPLAGLLPRHPADRAQALSVMAWFSSTLHIVRRQFARPMAFTPDPAAQAALTEAAGPRYWSELAWVDAQLSAGKLRGEASCLGVEAYALLFHHWAQRDGLPIERLESLSGLAARMMTRPDVAAAVARYTVPLAPAR